MAGMPKCPPEGHNSMTRHICCSTYPTDIRQEVLVTHADSASIQSRMNRLPRVPTFICNLDLGPNLTNLGDLTRRFLIRCVDRLRWIGLLHIFPSNKKAMRKAH